MHRYKNGLVFPFKNTRYLPSRCKKVPFIHTVKVQQIINVGTHLLLFNSVSSTCQPSYSKKKGKREGGLSSFVELEMALLKSECCYSCLFFKQRPFWIAWHVCFSRRTTPNILWIARNSGCYSWRMFGKLRAIPNFITFSFCIHHLYLAITTWQKQPMRVLVIIKLSYIINAKWVRTMHFDRLTWLCVVGRL